MKKKWIIVPFLMIVLMGCGSSGPVKELTRDLQKYPEYSLILQDMKEEGNFFTDYYHQYKIVYGEPVSGSDSLVYHESVTDWIQVSKKEYQKYFPYLGMVIASKGKDGKMDNAVYPPGYQYVGNPRYGHWRTDSRGNSFWEFYGKFAFFNSMFHMFSRPVYRSDWDNYRSYRRSSRPYFGQNHAYGTSGKYTKNTHPTFFQRQKTRLTQKRARFSDRVKRRVGRSNMSGFRRRSGGFGK